jgi:AMP phosphorylase
MAAPAGEKIEVLPVPKPRSIEYIKKKVIGQRLGSDEIHTIVKDINDTMPNEVEIAGFVMANHYQRIDFDETEAMARSLIETGERITFDRNDVVDKHSIGVYLATQ